MTDILLAVKELLAPLQLLPTVKHLNRITTLHRYLGRDLGRRWSDEVQEELGRVGFARVRVTLRAVVVRIQTLQDVVGFFAGSARRFGREAGVFVQLLDNRSSNTSGIGFLERGRQITVDLVQRGVSDSDVNRNVSILLRQILVLGRSWSGFWNYIIKTRRGPCRDRC